MDTKSIVENAALLKAFQDLAPFEEAVSLVYQSPAGLRARDGLGNLPLHVACGNNQSFEAISFLIENYPKALQATDVLSGTPLHESCCNAHLDIVRLLVTKYPEALGVMNYKGKLPLHVGCTCNASVDIITFRIEKYPEVTNENVEHNPAAVRIKDSKGDLPLHKAINSCQTTDVVAFLVEQYPEALDITNNEDKNPLQKATEFINRACIEYLKTLTVESVKTRQFEKRIAVISSFSKREWVSKGKKKSR